MNWRAFGVMGFVLGAFALGILTAGVWLGGVSAMLRQCNVDLAQTTYWRDRYAADKVTIAVARMEREHARIEAERTRYIPIAFKRASQ